MMTLFWSYLVVGSLLALAAIVKGPPKEYADATNVEMVIVAVVILVGWLPTILGVLVEKAID